MFVNIEQAQEIIFSLSRLLRYSMNNDVQNVLFEKDLDYIIDYLKLHKYRFNGRLEYDIEVDPEVKKTFVPKLLLQPLIENAIKYGYSKQTHLHIIIKGVIIEDEIIFTVIDNGGGIEIEKLHDIRNKLLSTGRVNGDEGIGLYNTHRRIALQYGERFGLFIDNLLDEGTRVDIKMPYYRGADEDV